MEVEGKEEEEGKENYFGANWNAWRDWLEWNTYALTRDSRFGFLRRAEWMSLTMLTRGCFSFFRGGGGGEMERRLTRFDAAKRSNKTFLREIPSQCVV